MDSALATLPLETLHLWRTEALNAIHALNTGKQEIAVAWLDRRLQSNIVDQRYLNDYLNRLQAAIDIKEGVEPPGRAPIHLF